MRPLGTTLALATFLLAGCGGSGEEKKPDSEVTFTLTYKDYPAVGKKVNAKVRRSMLMATAEQSADQVKEEVYSETILAMEKNETHQAPAHL
jgi:hypothetical protein